MKNIRIFYLKICQFLVVKFSIYLNRRVFVMCYAIRRIRAAHNVETTSVQCSVPVGA